jgi:hypothetical protein
VTKDRDPLGKRALFSGGSTGAETSTGAEQRARSAPKRKAGPLDVTVTCSACDHVETLSAPEIALKHLPVVAWLPWRKQSLLMRCPSCNKLAWHAASRA